MAQQQQKAPKRQDPYVARAKSLTSSVQRLRGWVGSDPSKTSELADALVELTAHRLLGHGYAAAGPDAQEAVRYAAQLLTANGPIGPYTSSADAARYGRAVVHLAMIQVGMGLLEAAGRTLRSLHDIRAQLVESAIELRLDPATAVWAPLVEARAALAAGEVPAANTYADTALARWTESGLDGDPEATYLAIDVERLASDARWAAGRGEEALGYLLSAKDRYDSFAGNSLREPGRLSEAVLHRLVEPLFGLYSDVADRLTAGGEVDLGLVVRRDLIEVLHGIEKRLAEPVRAELTAAEGALADDHDVRPAGGPVSWEPLSDATAGATVRELDADRRQRAATWRERHRGDAQRQEEERRSAERSEAERRREAERAAEVARTEREAAERAEAERAARLAAERAAAAGEAERQARKRRREERLEAHRLEVERREAEQREAQRQARELREAELRVTDPAEAERLELERLQAELAELERAEEERAERERDERERVERERVERERVEAERHSAERLEAELAEEKRLEAERLAAERAQAERLAAERAEAQRQAAERAEEQRQAAERIELERQEAERVAADREELAIAVREWQEAKTSGGRRAARAANERVVELLRTRASADFAQYGSQLRAALEELSRARLRAGDLLGSRAPAREAKALAERLPSDIG